MTNPAQPAKPKKAKGPIRTEAVVPVTIVVVLFWAYFHFIFDKNLKSALEYGGYQIIGAQVDISDLETSFWKASFRLQGLEITNAENPTFNVLKIGDIRYSLLWDGLLRARFIANEMAVEQIEFNTVRKTPGKVKPPEIKVESNEPSAMQKEAEKIKGKALDMVQEQQSQNVFGDIAALLQGSSATDQIKGIEDSLPSKAKLQSFEKEFSQNQTKWQERFKTLPQGKEIQALTDRLNKVKTSNFKTPQELQESLQQIDSILKEADQKFKLVQSTQTDLQADLKKTEADLKEIDNLVRSDIKALETRFKIPKIDAASISKAIFSQYLTPYMNQFNRYKAMAEKYVPPNLLSKGKAADEAEIKPHPRAQGVTYEFGRPKAYPLFWVKRISISSQAGASREAGNIKGLITDVTSNQKLIGLPTVASLEGSFPSLEILGLKTKVSVNNMKPESEIDFNFAIQSYALKGRNLISSPDVNIAFENATGALTSTGSLKGLRDFEMKIDNQFQKIAYAISAKNETIDSILKEVFRGIPVVTLDARGSGRLPSLPLAVESNLGPELQRGFEKQLQKKIEEAKAKLQAAIDQAIGKEKQKIEAEFNKFKAQYEGEIKKLQDQVNAQKSQAQAKVDQSKKDAENQANAAADKARRDAENQAKKAAEKEGKKALDDLKGKFGL